MNDSNTVSAATPHATVGSTSNRPVKGPNWNVVQAMWTRRDQWKAEQAAQLKQQTAMKMRNAAKKPVTGRPSGSLGEGTSHE